MHKMEMNIFPLAFIPYTRLTVKSDELKLRQIPPCCYVLWICHDKFSLLSQLSVRGPSENAKSESMIYLQLMLMKYLWSNSCLLAESM